MPGIELLQVLTALGPRPTVGDAATLLDSGGRDAQEQRKAVRGAAAILEGSALAWLTGRDTVAVNPGVRVVIDQPLGIGRTVAGHLEHTTLEELRQLLRNLGLPDCSRRADAVAEADRLPHRPAAGTRVDGDRTGTCASADARAIDGRN